MIFRLFKRPVKRRFAFIVTYGRSGSTLLMNIINSCEGCCIRGENNGALHSIYESYREIVDAQVENGKNAHRTSSPWWGISSVDADRYARRLVDCFVEEVIRPKPDDFLCGFKEIRFSLDNVPDLPGYLNFLLKFFPDAKIIFNHRDLAAVSVSKWWSSTDNAYGVLKELDDRFTEFGVSPSVFHFYYDEALKSRNHVRELFSFLDLPYEEDRVQEVFERRHSY